ncbi:LysR family transcriptional regulator [Saccharopolyspora sp. K220]|uniref:LysR family transcriptional regulator n=1 Tax=Saccharopolyspora soli TaxID=2926618 RepID=UPI001F59866B|nr:LysR family transcriptional regulator [Saccharopolyspora soli]MCI2422351.1 LysR family transcriptional regulator [Saccharopolyspora soli]
MDLRQLEHFVTVAEERHFTRAAERLFISQSGLSASIRALEKELGAELFIRNTRRVHLTEAGQALLEESRHTLASVTAAREAVAAVQGLLRGRLRVGTEQCLGVVDVPEELARFHAVHPGVELLVQQAGSMHLLEDLRGGLLDVAFIAGSTNCPPGVTLIQLASEPMTLICHPTHRLAGTGCVDWEALTEESFVDFHPDWGSRQVTDHAFAAARISRHIASEVNDVHTLLDLVGMGLGVAIVPGPIARKKAGKLASLTLPTDAPRWDVTIAVPAGTPTAAARTFLTPIRQRFTA